MTTLVVLGEVVLGYEEVRKLEAYKEEFAAAGYDAGDATELAAKQTAQDMLGHTGFKLRTAEEVTRNARPATT